MDTVSDAEEMRNICTYVMYMIFCIFHGLSYSWELPGPMIICCTVIVLNSCKQNFTKIEMKNKSVALDVAANCIAKIQPQ